MTVIRIFPMGESHVGVFAEDNRDSSQIDIIKQPIFIFLAQLDLVSYKCNAVQFGNKVAENTVSTLLVVLILSDLNHEQCLKWETNTAGPTAALLPEKKIDTYRHTHNRN